MKFKILSVLFLIQMGFSQSLAGGSEQLLTVPTSQTLHRGQFTTYTGINFYTTETKIYETRSINAWQVDGDLVFSYGVYDNVDLTLKTRVYQDSHLQNNNVPGNIVLQGKYGNYELYKRHLMMSTELDVRFGYAQSQNILFEDYFGAGLGFHSKATFSYYVDQYLPNNDFSAHMTLGFRQNLDNGKNLTRFDRPQDEIINTVNSNLVTFSLGLMYPIKNVQFFLEIDTYEFIRKPVSTVIGSNHRLDLNVGGRILASDWFNIDFGVGIKGIEGDAVAESYSDWRGFLGTSFTLRKEGTYGLSRAEIERNEYRRKIQTFKGLLEEQDNTDKIQAELEKLREEREKAERELEELKKILED